jgi:hypothetical protein
MGGGFRCVGLVLGLGLTLVAPDTCGSEAVGRES